MATAYTIRIEGVGNLKEPVEQYLRTKLKDLSSRRVHSVSATLSRKNKCFHLSVNGRLPKSHFITIRLSDTNVYRLVNTMDKKLQMSITKDAQKMQSFRRDAMNDLWQHRSPKSSHPRLGSYQ